MSLKHLEMITAHSRHPECLALFDGVLWVGQGKSGSAGVWLSARWFKEKDIENAYQNMVSAVGDVSHFKLVGTPKIIDQVEAWIQSHLLQVLNKAVRSGSFEVRFYPLENRIQVSKKLRVLIVDDSKTIRNLLTKILSSDPNIEVVGAAEKPSVAKQMMDKLRPDVVTLDLHMPEMDGLRFLKDYLPLYPIPTVMISSVSLEEGPEVLQCLEYGAVDYIQKPSASELSEITPLLIEKVKMASSVRVNIQKPTNRPEPVKRMVVTGRVDQNTLVAIGSSTGGTEALRKVLTQLPSEIPPIVIVQHIPAVFSKAFADRMNELCAFRVKEAEHGDEVVPNTVFIAPGGKQMQIKKRSDGRMMIHIDDSAPMNRHKPSVDFLFNSIADQVGSKCIGVILTGMGADGAQGLRGLRDAGARTIAQDEKSCVVFGMPREAIKLNAAEEVLTLMDIPGKVLHWLSQKKAA